MKLNLEKPIVFFDLETTGTNTVQDRIVEISYIKVSPNGNEDMHTRRVNPEMHIPEGATAVHGITDDDVRDCPTFKEIAKEIARDFEGSDIAGFNSNRFDVPLLAEEFLRAGVDIDLSRHRFIDVQVIFHNTRATYEVLMAQLDRYPDDLKNDMGWLSEFSSFTKNVDFAGRIVLNDKGQEVFNFGKYKDIPVVEVFKRDPGYYSWILQGDFALNTKQVLTRIKLQSR